MNRSLSHISLLAGAALLSACSATGPLLQPAPAPAATEADAASAARIGAM